MSGANLNFCRFCAEQKLVGNLLDLTDIYLQREIQDKISLFHGNNIDLATENSLPKNICSVCNTDLDNAYQFLLKTKQSQIVLTSLFSGENTGFEPSLDEEYPISESIIKEPEKREEPNIKIYGGLPVYQDVIKNTINEDKLDSSTSDCRSDISGSSKDTASSDLDDDDNITFYCGVPIFELNSSINSLDKDDSWTNYPWLCKHCDEKCPDIYLLREHSKQKHNLCCAFKCADCRKIFSFFEEFVEHVQEHRQLLRDYCEYCNKKLINSERDAHINTHKTTDHICDHCGKIFDNSRYLKEHKSKYKTPAKNVKTSKKKRIRSKPVYVVPRWDILNSKDKSWKGYPWSCQLCDSVFTDINDIRSHTKEAHGKCFAVKCVDCQETPDCYRALIYHVRKHRPHLESFCHYCNEELPSDKLNHIAQHFSNSQKPCRTCGEIFLDKTELQKHLTTYHPARPKPLPFLKRECPLSVDDFTCDVCDKVLKSMHSLRAHKATHEERPREYACDRCGKTFFTKCNLVAHYKSHEEAKPEVCKICKNNFKTLSHLKQHVKTHSEKKPFQCDVCQRSFRSKQLLTGHSIIHTDNKPYKCEYCDKTFKQKCYLRQHLHTHTGARPFTCSDCGMDFANWANCNKHMKRRHGTTLAKAVFTPQGKMPLKPNSLKPKKVKDNKMVKEWTEQILAPVKRRKKVGDTVENSVG